MPIVGSFAGASARAYGLGAGGLAVPLGYNSIASTTVGAGGASEIVFSSIPATYTHLQVRGIARNTTADGNVRVQFNSDTASNYSDHQLYADGGSTASYTTTSTTYMQVGNMPTSANYFSEHIIDILDYTNTNKFKTIRTLHGYDLNGSGLIQYFSGNWRSSSAITTVRVFAGNNNFAQYSSFALYGMVA
jgi:hypothetical protein